MSMQMCTCVYVCVCVDVHMYAYLHARACVLEHAYVNVCGAYLYVRIYEHMPVCTASEL